MDDETQGTQGEAPLREEDVTREDALNDDVREGDESDLPGDEPAGEPAE
jgi:hypothetical protein